MTSDKLSVLKLQAADVPCNGCRACCKDDLIFLSNEDIISEFNWELVNGRPALKHKSNGECIHLTESGCSVHNNPPAICRKFDCRVLFLETTKHQRKIRIQINPSMKEVYIAGKKRVDTLNVKDS